MLPLPCDAFWRLPDNNGAYIWGGSAEAEDHCKCSSSKAQHVAVHGANDCTETSMTAQK